MVADNIESSMKPCVHEIDFRTSPAAQVSQAAAVKRPAGHRILVLDDEIDVANTLGAQVTALGHQALVTTDHTAFFRAVATFHPDIVIIDTCMPGRDGLDILRELGGACTAKVVVTSGFGRRMIETMIQSAHHYGHDVLGALPKPARLATLKELLNRAPRRKSAAPLPQSGATLPNMSASDLRGSLQRGEFEAYFQPKLCLHSKSVCGFEALVRWHHPHLGILSPQKFLPQLQAHDLEADLFRTMLDQSCGFLSRLPGSTARVAVNAALSTVQTPGFRGIMDRMVARHGLGPERLIIELTEFGSNDLPQSAIEALARLRMAGYILSIDDFGTGVSSLQRLVRIPFSELKIDRSFLRGLTCSTAAQDIISTLVSLARSLDMFTTAEGVEDDATLRHIGELGCDVAQGFLIARPMRADAASRMYRTTMTI